MIYYRLAKLGPGRMPFVGSQRLDIEALDLIRAWIEQLPEPPAATAVPPELADKWKSQSESLERVEQGEMDAQIELLLADTHGGFALWQLIYDARVPESIEADIIGAGINSPNPAVRDLFEWLVPADERTQRLGTQFDPTDVLVLSGDGGRGREMFEKLSGLDCRSCHGLKRGEELIGPSLWGIGDKYDRPQLLDQILDPSKEVDPRFSNWLVETASGRIHSGLKVAENDREIVLKDATGKLAHIPVDDVDVVETMPKSLMPEQLLQALTAQQAADLLSFLQSLKKDGGVLQAL
jgi:putative heme-binding domain-containing protein